MEIQSAQVNRGAGWLFEGFDYFKRSALAWIGVMFIMIVVGIVAAIIPLGGLALTILMPILVGGLMLGCKAQDSGEPLTVGHLFAGFSYNAGTLALVGVIYFAGIVALIIVMIVLMIAIMGGAGNILELLSGDASGVESPGLFMLPALITLALYLPLIMALWFAPALVVFENLPAGEALKESFKGCLANIVPFLLYGVVGLVLAIIASIPLGLGWFILGPMVTASIYIAYREIFSGGQTAGAIGESPPAGP